MCCMNTTIIAADRNNFKVTFQVAFWGPIRPNFEYDHVAFREVRYLTDGVLPIFMSFAAIQSGFMLLFQGLVTCWNLTQTGPPRLYSFRTVQYSSCNFQVFFFTSFPGHRPAQREWAWTRLKDPMQGAIPSQSRNAWRLATPPRSTSPTLFEQ